MRHDLLPAEGKRAIRVGEQGTVLIGNKEARDDSVDTDVGTELHSHLACHELGVTSDSRLGCAVSDHACEGAESRLGAEIDDSTFLVVAQDFTEHLGRQHGTEEVEIDDLAEGLLVEVEEGLVGCDSSPCHVAACGVEEDIDSAIFSEDVGAVLNECLLIEDIGGEEHALAHLVELLLESTASLLVTIEDDDTRTLLGKVEGNALPEDTAAASKNDYFARDIKEIFI